LVENDHTLPYSEEQPIQLVIDKRNADLEKLFSEQQKAKSEVYKCRRDYVWEDFTAHRKKPWSDCSNNLVVTFLNESAVDTGGPRREFFSGDQSLS